MATSTTPQTYTADCSETPPPAWTLTKETSIRVIDEAGKIVWRGRRDSTPEAIAEAIEKHARHAVRIGLESGQLSTWLYHGLKERGLPVICIDARHARAALS